MTSADPDELRATAESVARRAGDMVLEGRREVGVSATTKSSPTDMVTQWDRASEQMVTGDIVRLRPDDGIVGEEGASRPGTTGLTWHVDPIDGTSNFFFDIPLWAVSVGVADGAGPLAGAVYAPALGEMWSAARGRGATLDGRAISVRANDRLADALVATGFSYRIAERPAHALRVARIVTEVRDIRRLGAAAIDLCFVACGRLDVYFEEHLHSWDLVAGQVIATEAGALVTGFAGEPVTPDRVLAATPGVHRSFVELLTRTEAPA